MTKKNQSMVNGYNFYLDRYGCRTIWDAYNEPSRYKVQAYDYCLNLELQKNGCGGTVCGANTFYFSYGFKYMDDAGKEHLMYITHANDFDIVLD